MRKFFIWLLESRDEPFDISFLSFWHIAFLLIIVSSTLLLAYYLNRHPEKKERTINAIVIALVLVYIADFFTHPLTRDDFSMNVDKLPFHICTALCPVAALTRFNRHFKKFSEPVSFLSVVAPLMYIVYPGSAIGDISPFCYEIIQTFVYHGLLFSFGVNMIATGEVKPSIRRSWHAVIGICLIALWASLGNAVYNGEETGHHYDWFFLTGSTFPFVPKPLMPLAVIFCVSAMVYIIYGIYYATVRIISRRAEKRATAERENESEQVAETV